MAFESAMVRTVCRSSHRLRQDVIIPQFSRMPQRLFQGILQRYADPRGAASRAARHSGLPRSNLRLPEGFRSFTPLTTGEHRPVSVHPALPPLARFRIILTDFACLRHRVPLRASRSIALPYHCVARHRHRCGLPQVRTGPALQPRLPSLRFHITSTVHASGRFVAVSPPLRSTFRRLEFKGLSPVRAHVPGRVSHR